MNGAFYIGAAGLQSQERALEVSANNIANVNTPGFKRSEVRFSELVAGTGADATRIADDGLSGVAATSGGKVFTPGELRATGRATDMAIDGNGFLELLGPEGQVLLWRGGELSVNADGFLAGAGGRPLRAMISVPTGAHDLSIDRDGVVRARFDDADAPVEIGKIDLVLVRDAKALKAHGEGLYRIDGDDGLTTVSPGEEGAGALVQGSLEASNVSMSDEMVTLLMMHRAYAANAQVVQAGDQLMSIANGLRR